MVLAGCGSSAPPGPRAVQLSLIAPTDGATVQVPLIFVYGTVQPSNAAVFVEGRRVPVSNGTFRQPYRLHQKVTRIAIVARSRGYIRRAMEIRVGYRPAPAGSSTAASGGAYSGSGSGGYSGPGTGLEAEFVSSCEYGGGATGGCQCIWNHLKAGGFGNTASLRALALSWRRSFLANGTITFPPAFRHAMVDCGSALQSGY